MQIDVDWCSHSNIFFSSEKLEGGSINTMERQDDLGRRQIPSLPPCLSQLVDSWVLFIHNFRSKPPIRQTEISSVSKIEISQI